MAGDRIEDHVQVAENLVVPEAEDSPTSGSKPFVPESVVVTLVVLIAIAFHNDSMGQAGKVDDEPSDDYFPAKMAFQLTSSQSNPEHCFGFRHPSPQFARPMLENPVVGFHPTNRARCSQRFVGACFRWALVKPLESLVDGFGAAPYLPPRFLGGRNLPPAYRRGDKGEHTRPVGSDFLSPQRSWGQGTAAE